MGSAQALMIPSLKISSSHRLDDWTRFTFIGAAWYSWEGYSSIGSQKQLRLGIQYEGIYELIISIISNFWVREPRSGKSMETARRPTSPRSRDSHEFPEKIEEPLILNFKQQV